MFHMHCRDQLHIKYISFQVLSAINSYWYVGGVPVTVVLVKLACAVKQRFEAMLWQT